MYVKALLMLLGLIVIAVVATLVISKLDRE
jgi:hypothetical protein